MDYSKQAKELGKNIEIMENTLNENNLRVLNIGVSYYDYDDGDCQIIVELSSIRGKEIPNDVFIKINLYDKDGDIYAMEDLLVERKHFEWYDTFNIEFYNNCETLKHAKTGRLYVKRASEPVELNFDESEDVDNIVEAEEPSKEVKEAKTKTTKAEETVSNTIAFDETLNRYSVLSMLSVMFGAGMFDEDKIIDENHALCKLEDEGYSLEEILEMEEDKIIEIVNNQDDNGFLSVDLGISSDEDIEEEEGGFSDYSYSGLYGPADEY